MFEYQIYKLNFRGGVHFGKGFLHSSGIECCADTFFSALFLEAMKKGEEDILLKAAREDRFRISDCFPFFKETYFLPKPMLHVTGENSGNSIEKKFYKNLQYIPSGFMKEYLAGAMEQVDYAKDLAYISSRTSAAVRGNVETLPYQISVCNFKKDAGLYVIVGTDEKDLGYLVDELLVSLSVSGLGGKRTEGLGRFEITYGDPDEIFLNGLNRDEGTKMLLSTALPREEEMEAALEDACYKLIQRSGYVLSETYAPEQRRKKTMYMMEAGSCFKNGFSGDVYDVSRGGTHPVYRYGKPLFFDL